MRYYVLYISPFLSRFFSLILLLYPLNMVLLTLRGKTLLILVVYNYPPNSIFSISPEIIPLLFYFLYNSVVAYPTNHLNSSWTILVQKVVIAAHFSKNSIYFPFWLSQLPNICYMPRFFTVQYVSLFRAKFQLFYV